MSNESLDLGSMLDQSLDSVPDAPEFVIPPAGSYRLEVMSAKVEAYSPQANPDTEDQRIRVGYNVVKTIQLADSNEAPVPDGSMFSDTFMGTTIGLGYFKSLAKKVLNVTDLNGVPMSEIFTTLIGTQFDCNITIRRTPNKKQEGTFFENVQIRVIPPSALEAVTAEVPVT